ncbi:hypothetical protein D9M71_740660 [compost metagenome]
MGQGIVDQVTQKLIEQGRLATQPHRFIGFQRQGHATRMGQRRHRHAQFTSQLAEVEQLRTALGNSPRTILDACQ